MSDPMCNDMLRSRDKLAEGNEINSMEIEESGETTESGCSLQNPLCISHRLLHILIDGGNKNRLILFLEKKQKYSFEKLSEVRSSQRDSQLNDDLTVSSDSHVPQLDDHSEHTFNSRDIILQENLRVDVETHTETTKLENSTVENEPTDQDWLDTGLNEMQRAVIRAFLSGFSDKITPRIEIRYGKLSELFIDQGNGHILIDGNRLLEILETLIQKTPEAQHTEPKVSIFQGDEPLFCENESDYGNESEYEIVSESESENEYENPLDFYNWVRLCTSNYLLAFLDLISILSNHYFVYVLRQAMVAFVRHSSIRFMIFNRTLTYRSDQSSYSRFIIEKNSTLVSNENFTSFTKTLQLFTFDQLHSTHMNLFEGAFPDVASDLIDSSIESLAVSAHIQTMIYLSRCTFWLFIFDAVLFAYLCFFYYFPVAVQRFGRQVIAIFTYLFWFQLCIDCFVYFCWAFGL